MAVSKRILIVDDEPALTSVLRQALLMDTDNVYEVQTANSGEGALQLLQGEPFDLVLADMRMPGIDGLQLIEAVRQVDPGTHMILMTAYGSDEVERQAGKLDVFRYMTKPFRLEDLWQAVRDALASGGVTGAGIPFLSDKRYEGITNRLRQLQTDLECQCVFLADLMGHLVVQVGQVPDLDLAGLAAIIGGRFLPTLEMARLLGSPGTRHLDYHETERYGIYSTIVGKKLILTVLFGRQDQTGLMGSVWDHTRRATDDLVAILETTG